MAKRFNITGLCIPEKHYMVDVSNKLREIGEMIGRGDYFTINRARQFGKTTTLNMIRRYFSEKYLIIDTSFEGVGDSSFRDEESVVKMFASEILSYLTCQGEEKQLVTPPSLTINL